MTQEEQRKEFEQALQEAWERYDCNGRLVDQFEDNYTECAFSKGFREGARWMLDHPSGGALLHVLNNGCKIGYRNAVEKACEWLESTFHDRSHHSGRGDAGEIVTYDFDSMQEFISNFRRAMEEQL